MKKKIFKIRHLIPAIIFFGVSVFLQAGKFSNKDYVIDEKKIEKVLHALENRLNSVVEEFANSVKKNEYKENNNSTWLINRDLNSFNESKITVLIYKNDTLKFWSDNSIPALKSSDCQEFGNQKVSQIGNGLYEVEIKQFDNIKIIGLLKLKNNFSYENQYLQNTFRPEFNLPASVKLSPVPVTNGNNIKDKNGKYIFSLVEVDKVITKREQPLLTGTLFFMAFTFFLIFLSNIFSSLSTSKIGSPIIIFSTIAAVAVMRYFSIKYNFPGFIYSIDYFNKDIYQGNIVSPTLGDLLVNSMLLIFFCVNLFKLYSLKKLIEILKKLSKISVYAFAVLLSGLIVYYAYYIFSLLSDLILKAEIPLEIYDILELNSTSIIAYVITGMLISSFILFADRIVKSFSKVLTMNEFLLIYITSSILTAIGFLFLKKEFELSAFILSITLVSIIIIIRLKRLKYTFLIYAGFIFLSSVYLVLTVNSVTNKKEIDTLKTLVLELVDQRDDVGELLLKEEEKKMSSDTALRKYILDPSIGQANLIHDYLERKYFSGFWKKYDLVVTICGNSNEFREVNKADYCNDFYENTVIKKGKKLNDSGFYFIDNHNGTISYWGFISIPEQEDKRKITLYIQLNSKLITKELGYPELLIEEQVARNTDLSKYSHAKYTKNKLITVSGDYPYNLTDHDFISKEIYSVFYLDEYTHIVYRPDDENCYVISNISPHFVDLLISFAYLFVFFNLGMIFSLMIVDIKSVIVDFRPDFKNKLRFSMILILFITFIIFGIVTIYYSIGQQKEFQQKEMSNKIHSVLTELEHQFSQYNEIKPDWSMGKFENLDDLMTTFSQIFFTDVNLYDLNGFLLATSRPEIFKQALIGRQINSQAYKKLVAEQRTQVIQDENIGQLNYASVYIPFKNHENKVIAYLNLPYFTNPGELQKNISTLLVTVINIYVVLLLLTIFIAFFISSKIVQPLIMLQTKFKEIKLGKKHVAIEYNRDDEIGNIVREYNRMSGELGDNIKKLTETERDTAWREMAKQIAHEIKNPLTPMKLSVQLLQRAWKDKKPDFDMRIDRVSHTLIEQIDTLSSIASEFSAFAKMPKAQEEEVDIIAKVETVVQLFEHTRDTDVSLHVLCNRNFKIIADKEQLSRVFINLIKNGIQSIPSGVHGIIKVEIITYAGKVKVTITDNGSGIPDDKRDKLFIPSFTTKTTGMGMGLAIVKNIIKNADGEIWFESEVGVGTSFFVEFPIIKTEL